MWPFSRKNDNECIAVDGSVDVEKIGCTAHHYGEYEPTEDYKVGYRKFVVDGGVLHEVSPHRAIPDSADIDGSGHAYVIKNRHKAWCEHQGCRETSVTWKTHAIVPEGDMDSIGYSEDKYLDLLVSNFE